MADVHPREHTLTWLNYHHLYYFWRIARRGSLSRAAAELRLTHSTLSAQLRALEAAFGAPLFERQGRRLVLTPLGEQVASYADEIFRLGGELIEAARGNGSAEQVSLRLGVTPDLPKTVAFRLLRPAVDLNRYRPVVVRQGPLGRLLDELSSGELHLILSDTAPSASASLRNGFSQLLGVSNVVLYGTKRLAKASRRQFPRSLEDVPLLLPTVSSSLRRQIDRWLLDRGIHVVVTGEFDDAGLMRTAGFHGLGVFPVREPLRAEVELEGAGVVEAIGRLEGVEERYYIVARGRRDRHPAVSAIIDGAHPAPVDTT